MKNSANLSDTDLCVMCGMCLPLCPTYQLYQSEAESPRGRIALIQSIALDRIPADQIALTHIDHCLGCLNCQQICPSKVPYGKIIDEFRDEFSSSIKKKVSAKYLLKQTAKINGLQQLVSLAKTPLISSVVKHLSILPTELLQQPKQSLLALYPAFGSRRGQVSLFTGCSGTSLDIETIKDTALILQSLNFDVHIPPQQACCGALHQHNGQLQKARDLLQETHTQIAERADTPILFFSPACGQQLQKSKELNAIDARKFIYSELQQQALIFDAANFTVALHESCSHRNQVKCEDLNRQLLHLIPHLEVAESNQAALCCGAGGLQSINYPEQANALLTQKLKSFDLSQVKILISDNIGCSLHIKSAINAYNPSIDVIHPLSLLARQLKQKP